MAAGVEIERKYLVERLPDDVAWDSISSIRQGYVALDGPTEVRVRLRDGAGTLTVKRGAGRVRAEVEVALDAERAEELWALTDGRRLEKARHVLRADGRVLEVDVYGGSLSGLVVAEVEFPDGAEADAFVPPPWFGAEVTGEPGYSNRELACAGRPPRES